MYQKNFIKTVGVPLVCLLMAAFLLAGCSSGAREDYQEAAYSTAAAAPDMAPVPEAPPADGGYNGDYAADNEMAAGEGAAASSTTGAAGAVLPQDDRKIVITGDMEMESKQFDKTCDDIRAAVAASGGYLQASQLNANYGAYGEQMAYFTVRVPATGYAAFADTVAEFGNVRSRNESSDDITSQYIDVEARLTSLRAQEKWLLDFMEDAKKIEDMLEIERQITDVQYQIESYTSQMRQMEQMTTYSTLNIWVYEVKELSSPVTVQETFGERIARAAASSWQATGRFFQNFAVLFVTVLPALLILGAIVVLILFIVSRAKKRALKKQPQPVPAMHPAMAMPMQAQPSVQPQPPIQAQPPVPPQNPTGASPSGNDGK